MKRVTMLLTTAFLIPFNCVIAQNGVEKPALVNDLMRDNLKGKVKSYTSVFSSFDSTGMVEKPDTITGQNDYDEKGYRTKIVSRNQEGKTIMEANITHYPNGMTMESTSLRYGKPLFKTSYEIDKNGKYTGGKNYDTTGRQSAYLKNITTNDYGMITSSERYGMNGKAISFSTASFDKTHATKRTFKDSTGKITSETTIALNDLSDPAEETDLRYVKDSAKTTKEVFKYSELDSKGNWTKCIHTNEKGVPLHAIVRKFIYYKD